MKYITKSGGIHIIPTVVSILCLIGFYFDYFEHEHSDLLNAIVSICSLLQVYAGFLAALLIILFKHTISDSLRGIPERGFRESLQMSKQYILTAVIQGVYLYIEQICYCIHIYAHDPTMGTKKSEELL